MRQPNIIRILEDDWGYSDIGCFGSEIATPNLDRLAAGVGHMVQNRGTRAYQGYLRDDAVTIAEVLKGASYRTLMSGK